MTPTSTPYFEHTAPDWDTLRTDLFPDSLRDRVVVRRLLSARRPSRRWCSTSVPEPAS